MINNSNITREQAKEAISNLLVATRGITKGEADDIIKEVQYVVNDTLAGDTLYNEPDDVLSDYLGLTADYTWIFLFDRPRGTFKNIPLFHDMIESLGNNYPFTKESEGK